MKMVKNICAPNFATTTTTIRFIRILAFSREKNAVFYSKNANITKQFNNDDCFLYVFFQEEESLLAERIC